MAVRCVPADPEFTDPSERAVWTALQRQLRDTDVLVANLRLTDENGDHEADLVVGMPGAGIAVIEVKGGQISHDGESWIQRGRVTKRIDPVEQARRTKYALRSYLDRDPRWGRRRVRFAHVLVFPWTSVDGGFALPDCPRWMVVDKDQLDDCAGLLWDALVNQETENPPADLDDVADLVEVISGRMLPQRDLLAETAERAEQADLLTSRQAVLLSAMRLIHRVEVRGGAGSGKTWLALEQARRLTREGRRVALTCYSRGLATYLRRRVEQLPDKERPAYVGTYHGLGALWGAPEGSDDDPAYFERDLPMAMLDLAVHLGDDRRFDDVVVDEAQDFDDSWWPPLLAALVEEESGGLYVFTDEGQRVFSRLGHPPVPLVPVVLDENLRNTVPIARTFGGLAPMQMRYRGGEGVPVRFVPCDVDDAVPVADDEIESLLEEGYAPGHLALLTTGHRHPEQVARQAGGPASYWESFWDAEQVFYGHVLGFKGMERPAVVLALNGVREPERAREMLYVGLSRARDRLVVCGDPEWIREYGGDGVLRRLTGGRHGGA